MIEKLFRPLVNAIDNHRRAVEASNLTLASIDAKLNKLDQTAAVGFATLVRTQLALMNGTERGRFEAHNTQIEVKLPHYEREDR